MSLNTLTNEQREACDKFLGFLLSDEKEFYLFGAAGCGKTFLTQHFISDVLKEYPKTAQYLGITPIDYKVAITATTNKAVEALNQGTIFPSQFEIDTIHKFLGIRVKEDYKTGETHLIFPKDEIVTNAIIFVDECSMLPKKVLTFLRNITVNCKLVFIGDNYQLAPVNEKPYWNSTPENVTVSLTIPIRNQNSASLINLCSLLRKNVDNPQAISINTAPGEIELLDQVETNKWLDSFNPLHKKVLSYTNNVAINYNKIISSKLGLTDTYYPGTIYINNSSYFYKYGRGRFYAEELVKVESIDYSSNRINVGGAWIDGHFCEISSVTSDKATRAFVCTNYSTVIAAMKRFKAHKDWACYFGVQNEVMDLRPPYASTIHKAQGNTYDEVLIDLDSFNACNDPDVVARLLYVAVSRARNKVLFTGSLPKRFGEIK